MQRSGAVGLGRPLRPDALATGYPRIAGHAAEYAIIVLVVEVQFSLPRLLHRLLSSASVTDRVHGDEAGDTQKTKK